MEMGMKNSRVVSVLVGLGTFLGMFHAGYRVSAQVPRESVWLEVNNLRCAMTNYGVFGQNVQGMSHGVRWANAPDYSFLLGSGIWVGAGIMNGGELRRRVFITYDPLSTSSWAQPSTNVTTTLVSNNAIGVSHFNDADLDQYDGSASQRAAQGFPLGLSIQQIVWLQQVTAPLQNTILSRYVVKNVHPERTLQDAVVAFVVDPDVGLASNPQVAAMDDSVKILIRGTTAVAKVLSTANPTGPFISVATIHEGGGTPTITLFNAQNMPSENAPRYEAITTGQLQESTERGDVIFALAGSTRDVTPGDSIVVNVVLLLSETDSPENDARLLDLVDYIKGQVTSVSTESSPTTTQIYPNPTCGSDYIVVGSPTASERLQLCDVHGVVRTVPQDTSGNIYIGDLSTGLYWITSSTGLRGRFVVTR